MTPSPDLLADLSADELLADARSVGVPERDLPEASVLDGRRIVLEGAFNLRDIGGYPTQDGRVIAWRRVLRSDHLNALTDRDVAVLTSLGLARIHDFRLEKERDRQPSRLPDPAPPVTLLNVGDAGTDVAAVDVVHDILAGRIPLPSASYWDEGYLDLLERGRPMFVAMISALAEPDHLPALFHCTGGKDRTGLSAFMLLTLLGVDRATATSDFLATNTYRTPTRARALSDQLTAVGVNVADALPILGVTRSALDTALGAIEATEGTVEAYLLAGGMDPSVPERLRSALLA